MMWFTVSMPLYVKLKTIFLNSIFAISNGPGNIFLINSFFQNLIMPAFDFQLKLYV